VQSFSLRKFLLLISLITVVEYAQSSPARAQTKLVLQAGYPVVSLAHLPILVAEEAGFFRDEGLQVEARLSQGAPQALQIAASGGADLGFMSMEPLIQGYEKRIRGKAFYAAYTRNIYFIAVPSDSPIRTFDDLANKKIGVSNLASAQVPITKAIMLKSNIALRDDAFLPVGAGDSAMSALRSGQVQALALWDAAYASFERAGASLRYLYHPSLADFGTGSLFASQAKFDENRSVLARFGRAFAKSTVFFLENPEAALKIYWKANPAGKIGKTEEEAFKNGLAELKVTQETHSLERRADKRFGIYDMQKVQQYIQLFADVGYIAKPFPADAIATNDLVPEINDFDRAQVIARAKSWK
jgi:NitT/TauT family transport system substrate-binding protein